jgi:hypothetical protein
MSTKYIYYKLSSLHGSITHFFHFFYGVLIPLILEYLKYSKIYENLVFIIGDNVGPMLKILMELPIDIKIKAFVSNYNDLNVEVKYLPPMDIHPTRNFNDIKKLNQMWAIEMTNHIHTELNLFMKNCINNNDMVINKKNIYDIVIIERKINKSHSSIIYAKNKWGDILATSGSERRSISNHDSLVVEIQKLFKNKSIINIAFEYLSFFEQYLLFSNAELVIAQHGAVLGHIIFMNKKSTVIEIVSKIKLNTGEDWFKPISRICEIPHHQYVTESEHTEIDVVEFGKFVKKHTNL